MIISTAFQDELLTNSWERCWGYIALNKNDMLRDMIIWKYSDPRRHYHNISHLIGCVQEFKANYELAIDPFLVELAIWIHDIENDINSKTNEFDSFMFFMDHIGSTEVEQFGLSKIPLRKLVLSTKHNLSITESSPDQNLICDIDLVTLGADDFTFDNYCRKIRKEYSTIPDDIYYPERLKILLLFLNKDNIYRTKQFRKKYESKARENLTKEVNRISMIINNL